MNKKQIELQIEPPIDKPALHEALARLEKENWITFRKIERGSARGVNSEITQKGLLELLWYYSRGPTARALRKKVFDLIDKSPALKADPEWVATVQSLTQLIQKLKTRILPTASDADINEEYTLSMIWDGPREALRKLIGWIEVTCLMENNQVPAPEKAFQELQTTLKKHPKYSKLAAEVAKGEIARYGRITDVKKALKHFVATNPF
jgi:DNA-binding PadR family transcriptional regulator